MSSKVYRIKLPAVKNTKKILTSSRTFQPVIPVFTVPCMGCSMPSGPWSRKRFSQDKTWRNKQFSRAHLSAGAPQTNNAAESRNKHLKSLPICKIRPSVCDSALRLLQEIRAMSENCALKKFHANDDDRGYTLTEVNDAIVFRSRLARNGNFLFPFWEDGSIRDDIPDVVVFCRSGLI